MRNVLTYIIIFIATLAGMAQPVTRIRLITLQAPPDTATQYFIQAGGGRDTIKYVPIDTIVAGVDFGTGTDNVIAKWSAGKLTNSDITDDGTDISIGASSNEVLIEALDSILIDAAVVNVGGQPSATIRIDDTGQEVKIQAGTLEQKLSVDDFGVNVQVDGGSYYLAGGTPTSNNKDWIQSWYNGSPQWINFTDSLSAAGGADGNGIISALPAGDVTIAAATNGLVINNMDTLALEATAGMSIKSNDIWLSQSGPNTTNIHTSPFTNFNGTGYVNFNVGYFGVPIEDSVSIVVDGFNDVVLINQRLGIDKYAAPKLPHFPSSFSIYTGTADEGRIVYNSTDNTPMFWDGSAWVNLADAATVPPTPSEGYAVVETATADVQSIANTWEALEAQTSAGLSSGWSFSTTTDLLTYTGSTAKYLVNFSACFTVSAATLYDYTFTVRENGTDGNAKAVQTTSGVDADVAYCVSGFDVVTANNGDTFGLGFISSSASSSNATIESSQLVMTKLVGQ